MRQVPSRLLLAVEAVTLVAPLTFFAGWAALISIGTEELRGSVAMTLCLLSLAAGWRLIIAFLLRGRAGLTAVSGFFWLLGWLGASLAVALALRGMLLTLLLLIPFVHLTIEHRGGSRSSMKKTNASQHRPQSS